MSIPGLGLIPDQPAASAKRTIQLRPAWEWRFEVPHGANGITVRLLDGTAERDGTELVLDQSYSLSGMKSSLLTWQGCTLEIEGACESYTAQYAEPAQSPIVSYLNLHCVLQEKRIAAAAALVQESPSTTGATFGPRVLVCGPRNSGKTVLARKLTAWATKLGGQPLLVSLDPKEGMLSLPGTISAGAFGTIMDVEGPEGGIGVGATPSDGPSPIPAKLPLVYYLGQERVEDEQQLWKELTNNLAKAALARLEADHEVRKTGLIIDGPALEDVQCESAADLLGHARASFDANMILVLDSTRLAATLQERLARERTNYGEEMSVVALDKSDGFVEKDQDSDFMQLSRETKIREYFFGNSKRTLSPSTQSVNCDQLVMYTATAESGLIPAGASADMSSSVLAVMSASLSDSPDVIRSSPVMGFVYVADVDSDRRRLNILTPVGSRLGANPLVWGNWPEAVIGLIG